MLNRLGLCAPSSCADSEIAQATQRFWNKRTLVTFEMFDISANVVQVRSTDLSNFYHIAEVYWISG